MVFLSASLVPASTGSSSSARAARISDAVRSPLGVAHNAIARAYPVAPAALDEPGRLQPVDELDGAGMGKPQHAPDRVDGLAGVVRDYDERARGAVVQARRRLGARRNPVGQRQRQRAEHVQDSGVGSVGHAQLCELIIQSQ